MQLSDTIRDAGLGRHMELIQRLAKPSIRLIALRKANRFPSARRASAGHLIYRKG